MRCPTVCAHAPWSHPWTSPSKAEAAEIFRRQAEAEEARLQQERLRIAELASMGIDHPYTYPGAPFTEFPGWQAHGGGWVRTA
ncbi:MULTISPECIES: hypothetical protein [unclassified Streptomyces]|uniref:Uncharacterized protein n=1 Tax=Streptomyces niveiscabiei TaxID=164115 RepID=A0ABW9I134_9ACTN|nr:MULTISPECIES: hypothetical protein [unclassified Streptomyces]